MRTALETGAGPKGSKAEKRIYIRQGQVNAPPAFNSSVKSSSNRIVNVTIIPPFWLVLLKVRVELYGVIITYLMLCHHPVNTFMIPLYYLPIMEVTCSSCGYCWKTKSTRRYVSCPTCLNKVHLPPKALALVNSERFLTLDSFTAPFIKAFQFIPEEDFARYEFGEFNGNKIYYYAINGEMCFTLKDFADYLNVPIKTVQQAFGRLNQRLVAGESFLLKERDFFEIRRNNLIFENYKMLYSENGSLGRGKASGGKPEVCLTFLGVWKLLPTFRGELPMQLWQYFGERVYAQMKGVELGKGEMYLVENNGEIVEQELGDPARNFIDCHGIRYSSKGEMLLGMVLADLQIKVQSNAPIALQPTLKNSISAQLLVEGKWDRWFPPYITADFLLRTKPRTVIEYWGLDDEQHGLYKARRAIKEEIYCLLDIRLISVGPDEPSNKPLLKKRLRKELGLDI
jgi:hypothetical protein